MKLTSFGLTAALLAALSATPAFAQERDAKRREAARAEQNAQRQAQPQREAARSGEGRRTEQPRARSGERRVGKEGRSRWSPCHLKKKSYSSYWLRCLSDG